MIFEDKSGARWRYVRIALLLLILGSLVLGADLVASFFVRPALPDTEHLPPMEALGANELKLDPSDSEDPGQADARAHAARSLFTAGQLTRTAFFTQGSASSTIDLRRHIQDLDVVFPDWFQWIGAAGGLRRDIKADVASFLASSSVNVMPLISNADGEGAWHGKEVSKLLEDRPAADALIQQLAQNYSDAHVAGINIDFETLAAAERKAYAAWIARLAAEFHRRKMLVTVDVPVLDPAFDYEAIGRSADAVIVMAYDEHYSAGRPGPIASASWWAGGMRRLARLIPPHRLLVGLGAYGYDWDLTSAEAAHSLSFSTAMFLAGSMNTGVEMDTVSQNEHFKFKEPDGDEHEIWLLDAVSAWDQMESIKDLGIGGFALWRMGLEEQGVWDFLSKGNPDVYDPAGLAAIQTLDSVMSIGSGKIFQVRGMRESGRRELKMDGKQVVACAYSKLPRFPVLEKQGRSDENKIALTFDDGPDPRWTPLILKILKDEGIRATFFLVGSRAEAAPRLVRQEYLEGNLLGNHTFLHPRLTQISEARLNQEVNSTQRAIESATGRQTTLFRAPFDADPNPTGPEQFRPLYNVCDHGYYVVGSEVDSEDTLPHTTQTLVNKVLGVLKTTGGNIIVFHDFGTRRKNTVDAVRILIPRLKKLGYQFVTVDELMNFPRDVVMPPIPPSESAYVTGYTAAGWLASHVWPVIVGILWFISGLAILRIVALGLMIAHSAFRRSVNDENFRPPVAVLIPAYNEAKVIRRTIDGVLRSTYPDLMVVVVDDGSTDGTGEIVARMARLDPRIRLISKPNGGKSSALNLGFRKITQSYIVTIDGDTIVHPDTVSHLIAPFADPTVDAVCGNVQVGNVHSLLTRFQDAEYVTTQNFDRRAFEAINCITVVPGATGGWKRESILRMGAYSSRTLTEDMDLTITVIAQGGRIVYAPLGKSVTEAPENLACLYKQRFRWSFGMLQSLWKHRRCFGHGLLGWIALPNILSQVFFQQFGPMCDLMLIFFLATGQLGGVARNCLILLALDLVSCLVAFILDKRKLSSLWVVLLQRVLYRPFLYFVSINAILAAFRGRRHGWNKLERVGSVINVTSGAEPAPPFEATRGLNAHLLVLPSRAAYVNGEPPGIPGPEIADTSTLGVLTAPLVPVCAGLEKSPPRESLKAARELLEKAGGNGSLIPGDGQALPMLVPHSRSQAALGDALVCKAPLRQSAVEKNP